MFSVVVHDGHHRGVTLLLNESYQVSASEINPYDPKSNLKRVGLMVWVNLSVASDKRFSEEQIILNILIHETNWLINFQHVSIKVLIP